MPKQRRDIEQLLTWAYREELPKQFAGGNSLLADLAMLGAPIDPGESDHGHMPVALGPPHPDALLIDYVVRGLDPVRVNWKGRREYLMGHLAAYLDRDDPITAAMATGPVVSITEYRRDKTPIRATAAGKLRKVHARATVTRDGAQHVTMNKAGLLIERQGESPAAHIMMHARMGTRPEWDCGPIRLVPVTSGNNKPQMIGRQINKRMWTAGTRYPLRLSPPPQEIACARFEYMVWHQALVALVELLRDLRDYEPVYPSAPAAPWLTGAEQKGTVFKVGSEDAGSRLPLKPRRPIAAPPLSAVMNPATTEERGRWRKQLTTSDTEG